MEVDYDLSEVMFICTSNTMNVPAPLLTEWKLFESQAIRKKRSKHRVSLSGTETDGQQWLQKGEIEIPDRSVTDVIRYTKEAGVRGLEREIAKICRKVVKKKHSLLKKRRFPAL